MKSLAINEDIDQNHLQCAESLEAIGDNEFHREKAYEAKESFQKALALR